MSETSREYIECRIFILGDEKVGKKSFVKKLLNVPSTSIIRNEEAEEEYNKLYSEMKEKMEQEKIRIEQQEALLKSINEETKSKKENEVTSRFNSTKSLFKIDEEKSFSRKSSVNLGLRRESTNRNVTTSNLGQNTMNNSKSVNSIMLDYSYSVNRRKIFREPVPEYPAKLFCIYLNKIVVKIFCIPKAEKRPSDFIPRDDDEEYELEKEHNISFDGIRKDLNKKLGMKDTVISQDKLNGFNTSIFTLFVFLYDMSNFYSFESLILYYSKIVKLYHINDLENFKACIVGNKKDKKAKMEAEQESVFNVFLKNTQLKKFEVSTKPYFLFDNFFIDFFLENFSMFNQNQTQTQSLIHNQKLLEDTTFIEQFKKIVKSKPNFSRSERNIIFSSSKSPGPDYNLNLYSFNSLDEIKDVFTNKKSRFNKKIFANKIGPIINSEKKEIHFSKSKDINVDIEIKGGLFNKPVIGFSFGIVKGKLNLLQKRKELRNKRNLDLLENIDTYNNSPVNKKPLKLSKDEKYFDNILKRKNSNYENIIKEKQLKIDKIMAIHKENIKKIELDRELNNQKIFNNHKKLSLNLKKSASSPNILFNSFSSTDELNEEIKYNKKRYHDIIYRKNKENLEKYKEKLTNIRLLSSFKKEPEPYHEDIREKILNPLKGRKILEKFKIVDKIENNVPYVRIKDEFDKIAEKASSFRPKYPERFPSTEKLRIKREEENRAFEEYQKYEEKKRERCEINRENSERMIKFKFLKSDRQEKLYRHYDLLKSEQIKKEAIEELRREISIQKGYGDPTVLNPINYSLVEPSSPKYSIKGRYEVNEVRNDDPGNLVLGVNLEKLNKIKEAQKIDLLPNFNYIKPKLPSIVFSKEERFPKQKSQYEDGVLLFEDGKFQPNTHQDFICKEPMQNLSPRSGSVDIHRKSPSPADYNFKSSFDIIAEQGEKISKIKNEIKKKKMEELKNKENKLEKETNNKPNIVLILGENEQNN